VRSLDGSGERQELVLGERRFDEREQHALLVTDVRAKAPAEFVERLRSRARLGGEVGGKAAQLDVVGEHADDVRVLGRCVAGERRQQDLLLDAEVVTSFLLPEREERVARSRRRVLRGSHEL
jgi:hypothetical protein